MVLVFALILSILNVHSQTYFVSSSGSDSSSCGDQRNPCATIGQVFINYPGASFTISISSGVYNITPISLERDAFVILQGTGDVTLITSDWRSGSFITNTQTSGLEFRDLALNVTGSGTSFNALDTEGTVFGLYNVVLGLSGYTSGDVIDILGGSVTISNVTLTSTTLGNYFILGYSNGETTSINVTGSTFNSLRIGQDGAFLVFDAYGDANIIIDSTTFNNVRADYVFIGFWAEDTNQVVTITNSCFNNTHSHGPSIYIENDYQCVIYVDNMTWNNCTADSIVGALEALGSDDGQDHNVTISNSAFTNNGGPYAGALLIAYNSLNLTNCTFCNNSGEYANDVVQGLDSYTSQFGYSITNSYSCSTPPKIVVWNLSTGTVTDISDQLPNPPPDPMRTHRFTREMLSVSPKKRPEA